jgi:hypothetical protein
MFVSVHIPKCAGTSFRKALQQGFGPAVFFDYGDTILDLTTRAVMRRAIRYGEIEKYLKGNLELKIIHGHFYLSKYDYLLNEKKYITIIRHPTSLVPSYYNYLCRIKRNNFLSLRARDHSSLESFVEDPVFQNIITRLLSPLHVNEFAYIGIQENYQRSIGRLGEILGVKLSVEHENVASARSSVVSEPLLRRICELNWKDVEFYEDVRKSFHL